MATCPFSYSLIAFSFWMPGKAITTLVSPCLIQAYPFHPCHQKEGVFVCKLRASSSFQSASATVGIPMIHAVQATAPPATKPRIQGTKKSQTPSTILTHSVTTVPGLASAHSDTAMSAMPAIHASRALGAENQAVLPKLH